MFLRRSPAFWRGFWEGVGIANMLIGIPACILAYIAVPMLDPRFNMCLPFAFALSLWWASIIREAVNAACSGRPA